MLAHEEALALRSGAIGTGHLLLGVLGTMALLVPLRAHDVRIRIGVGDGPGEGGLPFTDAATRALEAAPQEAERLGHELATPAHLLLALAADPVAVASAASTRRACATRRCSTSSTRRSASTSTVPCATAAPLPCGSETASCPSATSAIRVSTPAC